MRGDDGVMMCTSHLIVHITERHVHRMVFLMSSGDGYSRFVCAEHNGCKHTSMKLGISRKQVLYYCIFKFVTECDEI